MKKFFTLFLLALFFSLSSARAGEIQLGYCNGQVTLNSSVGTTGRAWVDAAILLPASVVNSYEGNEISSIRVGLASSLNVDSLVVWVRSSLNGDNLASDTITRPNIKRGWNVVALRKPYELSGNDGNLYIGYSFKQRGNVNAISYIQGVTANAFWVRLGADAAWEDRSSTGALSLEATVSGDNIYNHDVGLSNQAARLESNTGNINLSATFKNFGTEAINDVDIAIGAESLSARVAKHFSLSLAPGESRDTTLVFEGLPTSLAFASDAYVTVTAVNGVADENPSNDSLALPFAHERKVMIEEFTTEGCTNCPRLAKTISDLMENPDYKGKIIAVAHHAGFGEDWLTRPEDSQYLWFYASTSTYAPALMVDRYAFVSNSQGRMSPVFDPNDETLKIAVDYRLAEPTYTSLNISANYADENNLNIQVNGFRARPFGKTPTRITLYLVEDSITAHHQIGASVGFKHMHVERAINSTWGELVDWQADGTFTYNYSVKLDDAWNRDHLSVEVAIGDYDPDDLTNCVIENAEQLRLSDISTPAGISSVNSSSAAAPVRYYTLDGRLVNQPVSRGVTIVKQGDKAWKIVKK